MRASDADRERAADVLKAGYAEGRLSKGEYDQRLTRVHQASTYGELHTLLADLPQGPVPLERQPQLPQPQLPQPHLPPQPVWATPPLPPTNGAASGAMVCGVLTPFTGGLTAIPAVVLGHKARAEIRSTGERGDGMAVAGLVMGYLAMGFWFMVIFFSMLLITV
ncbi:DUF1707 and DUF4190 domain-containing protein [Streptomyces gobiensis]|uniref:DUF1707 and DUF4190 domain-containing protein n=1 Tax=Streptomyces gobiensis TaxID=2875706 RepID=UPI001E2E217A|nr:DUF1707 and DUF4190 domain-containing protein [Streptomyces gobiensis]UGY95176.1 DUF1707 and DUF4190 domain-containing protein [Streptomyces gobiensis]